MDRGLVAEKTELIQVLTQINYYRLSGYLYPFKQEGKEDFVKDTTLYKIKDRYLLDRKLRFLLFDAIEVIEISILRSRLVEYFAGKYGAFCHADIKNFKDKEHSPPTFHSDLLVTADDFLQSNIDYVSRYREHYPNTKNVPFWMLVENLTFGTLSKLLGNMHKEDRAQLANQFNLPHGVFVSWIHAIAHARNLCAHHERLWNRYISITPKIPEGHIYPEFHKPVRIAAVRSTIFPTIVVIQFLLNTVEPTNGWGKRLNALINDYSHLPAKKIGFPDNWREQAFFGLTENDAPKTPVAS